MHKRAFLENLTPEQRGALIGSMVGAGGLGLTTALASKKNKMRNALLAALAGGAGGAGLGYFAPGLMGGAPKEQAGPQPSTPGELGQVGQDISGADRAVATGTKPKVPDFSAFLPAGKLLNPPSTIDALTSTAPNTDPLGGLTGNVDRMTGTNPAIPSGLGLPLSALLGTVGAAGAVGGKYKGMADKAQQAAETAKTITPFKELQPGSATPPGARGKNVAETPEQAKARRISDEGSARVATRKEPTTVQRDADGRIVGMESKHEKYKTKGPQLGQGLPKLVGGAGFGNPLSQEELMSTKRQLDLGR